MSQRAIFHPFSAAIALSACLLILNPPIGAASPPDFIRDIQPIFERHCLNCHGPAKQKSGYRLDAREVAFRGGDHGERAIVPHDAGKSFLLRYVSGLDDETVMPPPKSNSPPLNKAEIATLTEWIDSGAPWPDSASFKAANPLDWWSLKPLVKSHTSGGNQNSIDSFISLKLAEQHLSMAPPADARALCRRLYFDLTGLPPSPQELDVFDQDSQHDSAVYEHLVDKLLASPRYGERWARHWLDVVHYGDTHGFDKDQPRPHAWPYRDYVIRAFNEDKPYAQFVQEQLAGDRLFPGTRDGIEALGFLAAGPWDLIGHAEVSEDKIDGKVARHLDRDDIVGNVTGTFCSTTAQCAQCHNHKFDPISQEDYYSLQSVFAAIDRTDRTYDFDPAVTQLRASLIAKKADLDAKKVVLHTQIKKMAGPELVALDHKIATAESTAPPAPPPEYGWHSGIAQQSNARKWVQIDLGSTVAVNRVVLIGCWDDFNGIGAGFGFPVRFRIEASHTAEFKGEVTVIAAQDTEDYLNPGTTPRHFSVQGIKARYIRITASKLARRENDFIFALAEVEVFDGADKNVARGAAVTSLDSIEAPARWSRTNLTDGIFPGDAGRGESLTVMREQREQILARIVDEPLRKIQNEIADSLAKIDARLNALPPVHTVYAGAVHTGQGSFAGTGANGGKPRAIHVLTRGQVTLPGPEVGPGALSAITALPGRFKIAPDQSEGARRAALAQWITDVHNPLTWRSIVNRVWQYHFGRGLVDTPNDFGRMGALPTHPELLDWLAADFRDSGGSLKQLHKLILMSAAYRQSSSGNNITATQIDANNTLLWRQNRRKLEAEAVHDAVLAVSGGLDLTMGGPGWQDFVMEHPEHSPHYEYDKADPKDIRTWRRSIYRFTVRSQMHPFMTALDCADPSMRVDKRNESASPAQALALLNNGFMVTQSEIFALRIEREFGASVPVQVEGAFRLALGRKPSEIERDKLNTFVKERGLANLCRVLLNLNEFVFVD